MYSILISYDLMCNSGRLAKRRCHLDTCQSPLFDCVGDGYTVHGNDRYLLLTEKALDKRPGQVPLLRSTFQILSVQSPLWVNFVECIGAFSRSSGFPRLRVHFDGFSTEWMLSRRLRSGLDESGRKVGKEARTLGPGRWLGCWFHWHHIAPLSQPLRRSDGKRLPDIPVRIVMLNGDAVGTGILVYNSYSIGSCPLS